MTERGDQLARYQASPRDQRALAHVRTVSALLATAGAVGMLLGKLSLPLLLVALLGLLISLAWLGQARRLRRAAQDERPASLTVFQAGFAVCEREREDWLAWSEVARVEVDEERLDVVVTKQDGSILRIEPRYAGVDLYELVHTLDNARASAQSASGHADSDQQAGRLVGQHPVRRGRL
jgi:hypothetical protein